MAKNGKGKKKPVAELIDEEVVQLVVDVVRRLRRVTLHPLALAPDDEDPWSEPGGLLRKLMNVYMTVTVVDGQPQVGDDTSAGRRVSSSRWPHAYRLGGESSRRLRCYDRRPSSCSSRRRTCRRYTSAALAAATAHETSARELSADHRKPALPVVPGSLHDPLGSPVVRRRSVPKPGRGTNIDTRRRYSR
jgi:hypothetical protein